LRQRQEIKRCCGAVVAINPVSAAHGARQCGTCTACCDGWVKGTILGHEMKPGQPCHFRGEGCCTIYERRPVDPCRNFICAVAAGGKPVSRGIQADRLGVLIIPVRWRTKTAYILRFGRARPGRGAARVDARIQPEDRPPVLLRALRANASASAREFQMEMLAKSIAASACGGGPVAKPTCLIA